MSGAVSLILGPRKYQDTVLALTLHLDTAGEWSPEQVFSSRECQNDREAQSSRGGGGD